jgi:hypothetical protein
VAQLTELEKTLIEWRCSQLVARFALLNDACDYEALAACFTEDAIFTRPTMPDKIMQGRQLIFDQFRQRPPRTLRHLMANTVINAESATRATGTVYMILYAGPPLAEGEPGPPLTDQAPMIGQFKDVFAKVSEDWLFAERRGSLGLTLSGKGLA